MQTNKKKFPVSIYLLPLFSIFACSQRPLLWPHNGQKVLATYYKLATLDTSKISVSNNAFILPELPDSAIRKYDTITYTAPRQNAKTWFSDLHMLSVKKHSGQTRIEEYYTFDKGSVKLAGYTINDSLHITAFSKPLVVLPALPIKYDTSSAVKTDWDFAAQKFTGKIKMKTQVQLLSTPVVSLKGMAENGYLYSITISSDATVGFGNQNLIVPDAIVMKSKLLFSKTRGLLFEWSIKNRTSPVQKDTVTGRPEIDTYLEVITYKSLN